MADKVKIIQSEIMGGRPTINGRRDDPALETGEFRLLVSLSATNFKLRHYQRKNSERAKFGGIIALARKK
jgi:hypothetical protein